MKKNKIIKGTIPYSDLNPNLNFEPDDETIEAFEKLITLVGRLSEEEKQAILKSK
ncbi:hypothetical protein [Flagellimonas sp.]|uniref:hypothetical protein n=1 Tax=Flagellimonas sp. TaxID=2058762 RepID=UPI003BB10ABF